MIPLYDTVRTRKFPVVNILLIVANVLVFLYELQLSSSGLDHFISTWGLVPVRVVRDPAVYWITIFTSMFIHGGWLHIIGNMWFLYIFGDNVEGRMGGGRYLVFYLLSGVAAALLQIFILPTSSVPTIGASGAIAGVLGAYLVSFPRARIASLVPILFIFTIIEIPAAIFLILWFVLQIYSGLFAIGASASGIAWWAHVGGFVFGMLAISFFATRAVYRNWNQE